ncbi:PspC domain-containing protein [Persicobacter psychrovividus]|uniref:PspC domain-containing protein n=1 Tax=Persicobacter psychrovividus TaxID=387638 RepID=A0ABN6L7T3_9BACT|nr:PspC domain-containing protein [Persicobacter psychrovividus]
MERRLYRSINRKLIAGVCAGIGVYFNIDPVIIRLIFILLFLSLGIGFLAYAIMWIVIPADRF